MALSSKELVAKDVIIALLACDKYALMLGQVTSKLQYLTRTEKFRLHIKKEELCIHSISNERISKLKISESY